MLSSNYQVPKIQIHTHFGHGPALFAEARTDGFAACMTFIIIIIICFRSAEDQTNPDGEGTKLTLAYERLNKIPQTIVERFSEHIKYLDISHNKIK